MINFKMSLEEGKFKSIFYFLKFALEKDRRSKNIVDILVSVLKTWDIIDLVIYYKDRRRSRRI